MNYFLWKEEKLLFFFKLQSQCLRTRGVVVYRSETIAHWFLWHRLFICLLVTLYFFNLYFFNFPVNVHTSKLHYSYYCIFIYYIISQYFIGSPFLFVLYKMYNCWPHFFKRLQIIPFHFIFFVLSHVLVTLFTQAVFLLLFL